LSGIYSLGPEKLTEDWVLSPVNSTAIRRLSRSLEERPLPLNMSVSPRGHHEAPRATPVEHHVADGAEGAKETHNTEEVQLVDVSSSSFLERYVLWTFSYFFFFLFFLFFFFRFSFSLFFFLSIFLFLLLPRYFILVID
jgi:hypothetical protein